MIREAFELLELARNDHSFFWHENKCKAIVFQGYRYDSRLVACPRVSCIRSNSIKLLQRSCRVKVFCSSQRKEVRIVRGSSMNEVYDELAMQVLSTATIEANSHSKFIVGLAGPPGAGKSTVAAEVVQRVNKLWPDKTSSFMETNSTEVAVVLPMDGFHLYRSQLDAMEDPEEAHARRGAPWTFTPDLLLKCLHKLRDEGFASAPSFSHSIGDPIEDDILVSIHHRVIIVEGNYLLLDDTIWQDISSIFDQRWFIEVDIDTSMQRVLSRHISTGKAPDMAKWRIEYNDRPNAELIMASKKNAELIIHSVDI